MPIFSDHPHAGGEYWYVGMRARTKRGPSPRGWGIRFAQLAPAREVRTIPTRVGNTTPSGGRRQSTPDHPHAGGEYGLSRSLTRGDAGPSPRGWGIPLREPAERPQHRTIPTRVGNTSSSTHQSSATTDHPHAGGEYPATCLREEVVRGPSPRGWGIPKRKQARRRRRRTIPTRVGNTSISSN